MLWIWQKIKVNFCSIGLKTILYYWYFFFSDLNVAVTCRHTKFRLLQFEKVHLLYLLSHTVTFLDKFVTVMVWCKILKDWMEKGLSYKKGDFTKEPFCETCCLFYAHILLIRDMVVECWNRQFGCEIIHPTENSISMNLLQMSCVMPKTSYLGAHFGTLTQRSFHP